METARVTFALIVVGAIFAGIASLAFVAICGHFVGRAARMKNRSYFSFFWLTILLSPIVTGLIVAVLPFNSDDPRHPKNKAKIDSIFGTKRSQG